MNDVILHAVLYHLLTKHGPLVMTKADIEALPEDMDIRLTVVDGKVNLSVATE